VHTFTSICCHLVHFINFLNCFVVIAEEANAEEAAAAAAVERPQPATPRYNAAVLSDALLVPTFEWIRDALLDNTVAVDALILLKARSFLHYPFPISKVIRVCVCVCVCVCVFRFGCGSGMEERAVEMAMSSAGLWRRRWRRIWRDCIDWRRA
jgi:hypothetical protein